jgi:hypothetical protein
MGISHIFRVAFAIAVSGAIGWVSLAIFNFIKIWQGFEAFEAAPEREFERMPMVLEQAVDNISGGSAVFLATGIAGVLLGEIFKTRSLLFYAGATGALAAVLAAALWQQTNFAGDGQAAATLAMAGFVAGTVYWMVAGHGTTQKTR